MQVLVIHPTRKVEQLVDKSGWIMPATPTEGYKLAQEQWEGLMEDLSMDIHEGQSFTFTDSDKEETGYSCWLEYKMHCYAGLL
jgi:hypothetical protein